MRDLPAPRTAEARGGFRLGWITSRAIRSLRSLSANHRRQIREQLARTLPPARCTPVRRLWHYRIYHYDVNETVRLCFRMLRDGRAVVMHAGTHPEFDRFAEHYEGTIPRLIPIQDCELMKSIENGKPQSFPEPTNGPPARVGLAPATAVAEAISVALQEFLDRGMALERKQSSEDLEALGDLLRGQTASELESLRLELSALERWAKDHVCGLQAGLNEAADDAAKSLAAAMTGLRGEILHQLQAVQSAIGAVRQSMPDLAPLASGLARCREEATALAVRLDGQGSSLHELTGHSKLLAGELAESRTQLAIELEAM